MDSADAVEEEEIDSLERGLLTEKHVAGSREVTETEAEEERVLYKASFAEMEEKFVKYQTAQWVMYSLLLMVAWGIGLLMLLYLPVRIYILRKDIRSRQLYLTPDSIVYKRNVTPKSIAGERSAKSLSLAVEWSLVTTSESQVTRPVAFPFFGDLKKEKHVLLASVADVVIEQGYLQSLFGVYSLRIENAGVRRPPSDDVRIQGVANPSAFRKAVAQGLAYMRSEAASRQGPSIDDVPSLRMGSPSSFPWTSPSKSIRHDLLSGELMLLQKLEEVGSSVKRVESLIQERGSQTSEPTV